MVIIVAQRRQRVPLATDNQALALENDIAA
jgi:hypothetical protein